MAIVALSTASFFPDTEMGFRMAAEHGFDAVEVMVNHDRRSQTVESVQTMSTMYGVPIRSVHVPCLVVSQHVWGWNPETKLRRSVEMAKAVGADTVVVHPPFRWQREYAAAFPALVDELHEDDGGPALTVENMFTVAALGRRVDPYLCTEDPALPGFAALTLDTSHAAAARRDPLELYDLMQGRVRHLHLSDSTSTRGDEHLPPGRGTLDLVTLADKFRADGYDGHVVVEVAIVRLPEADRSDAVAECRAWVKEHFDR